MESFYENNKYRADIEKTKDEFTIRDKSEFTYITDTSEINMPSDVKCSSIKECMSYIANELNLNLVEIINERNIKQFIKAVEKHALILCIHKSNYSDSLLRYTFNGAEVYNGKCIGFIYIAFKKINFLYNSIDSDILYTLSKRMGHDTNLIIASLTDEIYKVHFYNKESGELTHEGPFVGSDIDSSGMYRKFLEYDDELAEYMQSDYICSLF